ncbi:hypothetical protein [Williamsia serinedens]|uniref:hypothetical protein n=1 Tax=Williamsia serinedens TaxID=391736 RepID=UPI002FE917EE
MSTVLLFLLGWTIGWVVSALICAVLGELWDWWQERRYVPTPTPAPISISQLRKFREAWLQSVENDRDAT